MAPPCHRELQILVVDDCRDTVDTLALLLQHWGHQPILAYDAISVPELAREHKPDVALVDIGLPCMNGYELAQKLRSWPETKTTFLVALTGYAQEGDRQRCQEAGFDCYLMKPADPDQLKNLLAALQETRCHIRTEGVDGGGDNPASLSRLNPNEIQKAG
jgi:CheY-like chemotaxis protein